MARRRRRGARSGLTGIVVAAAALHFTGGGQWLWGKMEQLESQCYTVVAQMGLGRAGSLCTLVGSGVQAVDQATETASTTFDRLAMRVQDMIHGTLNLNSAVGGLRVPSSVLNLASSQDALMMKLKQGPASLAQGSGFSARLQQAMDGFTLGQRYMAGGGGASSQAVPWFQQGAQVPGYGLLSQLSLGDLYRQGTGDVGANPQAAIEYYAQAHQSIGLLEQSNTPEAKAMLASLPASPQEIQQQLLQVIRQMKSGMIKK